MSDMSYVYFETSDSLTIGTVRPPLMLEMLPVSEFGREVQDYVRAHPDINLLLNFQHVQSLSSAVLTELIQIRDAIYETGGTLRLCGLNANILEIFKITKLDKLFQIDEWTTVT